MSSAQRLALVEKGEAARGALEDAEADDDAAKVVRRRGEKLEVDEAAVAARFAAASLNATLVALIICGVMMVIVGSK